MYFPSMVWLYRTIMGRLARRIYLAIFLLLLCATMVARIRSVVMARKFQAVLTGLERVSVDQTTEAELIRTVPYMVRGHSWKRPDGSAETWYGVVISNESDWLMDRLIFSPDREWLYEVADLLGYRYLSFSAGVIVLDGKVSSVRYAIANELVFPRQIGEIVSAKSVHGFWRPYRSAVGVTSADDESPQYRVERFRGGGSTDEDSLNVRWTFDAPPDLISHVYRIDLSCFWGLRGCRSARQIAPLLWQDKKNIEDAALARLHSREPCPDRVLAGRVRYLPDVDVLLLEVVDSRRVDILEDMERYGDFNTDHKLIEVIRGRPGSYPNRLRLRYNGTIPSPVNRTDQLANPLSPMPRVGDRVLFFSNDWFESCRVVPAAPSALSAVRTTAPAPKRPEDEPVSGLR